MPPVKHQPMPLARMWRVTVQQRVLRYPWCRNGLPHNAPTKPRDDLNRTGFNARPWGISRRMKKIHVKDCRLPADFYRRASTRPILSQKTSRTIAGYG